MTAIQYSIAAICVIFFEKIRLPKKLNVYDNLYHCDVVCSLSILVARYFVHRAFAGGLTCRVVQRLSFFRFEACVRALMSLMEGLL